MAVDDALAQRTALVRAAVAQREDRPVCRLEDGDVAARRLNDASAAERDVVGAPGAASKSFSSARPGAMPLPTTTSDCLVMEIQNVREILAGSRGTAQSSFRGGAASLQRNAAA
jgi:hypothetical protein